MILNILENKNNTTKSKLYNAHIKTDILLFSIFSKENTIVYNLKHTQ